MPPPIVLMKVARRSTSKVDSNKFGFNYEMQCAFIDLSQLLVMPEAA